MKKNIIVAFLSMACVVTATAYGAKNNLEKKTMTPKKIVQTAGRTQLGDFAPEFAHYNDDVLFGENWNNQDLDLKTRSLLTVTALMAQGITDDSLKAHLQNAKAHGVTKAEIAAAITHNAFYAGWPKAWATFRLAKEVWKDKTPALTEKDKYQQTIMFPIGKPNDAYAKYFKGQSYLAPVSTEQVTIYNVTFEPKCRNNWHIHHATKGGGQMLVAVGGRVGYFARFIFLCPSENTTSQQGNYCYYSCYFLRN
jgi:4-carboxymuconolactone decarboxylase